MKVLGLHGEHGIKEVLLAVNTLHFEDGPINSSRATSVNSMVSVASLLQWLRQHALHT
jgi:hypothetical protein